MHPDSLARADHGTGFMLMSSKKNTRFAIRFLTSPNLCLFRIMMNSTKEEAFCQLASIIATTFLLSHRIPEGAKARTRGKFLPFRYP